MIMINRLERLGGLRQEEFLLLKAVILSNSLTLHSSSSNIITLLEEENNDLVTSNEQCDKRGTIQTLRESLLSSLHDCVAVLM